MNPLLMLLEELRLFVQWLMFHSRNSQDLLQEAYRNLQTLGDQPALADDERMSHYRNQTILPGSEGGRAETLSEQIDTIESQFEQGEFLAQMADDALYCRRVLSGQRSDGEALAKRTVAIITFLFHNRDLPIRTHPGRRIVLGELT